MHDLVITGGVVHDGLGSPGVRAVVAIQVVVDQGVFTGVRAGDVLRARSS